MQIDSALTTSEAVAQPAESVAPSGVQRTAEPDISTPTMPGSQHQELFMFVSQFHSAQPGPVGHCLRESGQLDSNAYGVLAEDRHALGTFSMSSIQSSSVGQQ